MKHKNWCFQKSEPTFSQSWKKLARGTDLDANAPFSLFFFLFLSTSPRSAPPHDGNTHHGRTPPERCARSLLVPPIQVIIIRLSRNRRKYISFIINFITIIIMCTDLRLGWQVDVKWEREKEIELCENEKKIKKETFYFSLSQIKTRNTQGKKIH